MSWNQLFTSVVGLNKISPSAWNTAVSGGGGGGGGISGIAGTAGQINSSEDSGVVTLSFPSDTMLIPGNMTLGNGNLNVQGSLGVGGATTLTFVDVGTSLSTQNLTATGTVSLESFTNPWQTAPTSDGQVLACTQAGQLSWTSGGLAPTMQTFFPAVSFGGNSDGITYTTQVGYYQVVGNTTTFFVKVALNSQGTSTGVVGVGNMPFIAHDNLSTQIVFGVMLFTTAGITQPQAQAQIMSGANLFTLIATSTVNASVQQLNDTNIISGSQIIITGTIFTN